MTMETRKPIGSDFVTVFARQHRRCSECSKVILKGESYLASIKDGKVKKTVCSEECRLEFDARFWQNAAKRNTARRKV
jgi:predicted nucleic acid-binding Zn ribbon protein